MTEILRDPEYKSAELLVKLYHLCIDESKKILPEENDNDNQMSNKKAYLYYQWIKGPNDNAEVLADLNKSEHLPLHININLLLLPSGSISIYRKDKQSESIGFCGKENQDFDGLPSHHHYCSRCNGHHVFK